MLLTTLATIGGIGSSIASAIGSARASNNAQRLAERGYNATDAFLRSRYYADYTKRSDFQALMSKQKELADLQYKREKGVNAVIGGNDAGVYAQKMANSNALAQTMSNAGAQSASYKEGIEAKMVQNQAQKTQSQANEQARRAQTMALAGGEALKAMFGLADADEGQLDGLLKRRKEVQGVAKV